MLFVLIDIFACICFMKLCTIPEPKQDYMRRTPTLFSASTLDSNMETGLAILRQNFKKSKYTRLQHLPVNLFGAVMGIAGMALAWKQAAGLWGISPLIGEWMGVTAVTVFIVLSFFYLLKFFLFPHTVISEFNNPIVGNFFGTINISILLLSAIISPHYDRIGYTLWITGVTLTLVLAYIIVNRLIKNKQDLLHATPVWLIPGVGTLDIAVAGGHMPFAWATEVNLLAFAIGSVLALVFFTLIISRLMHHDPMPEKLTPSLIILIAPFEVGFLAYINIKGQVDLFAAVLFYFGLFIFSIVFFKVFNRRLPFMLTWWAVGFPIAALANASLKYAHFANTYPLKITSAVILGILTLLIGVIFVRTMILLLQKQLLKTN